MLSSCFRHLLETSSCTNKILVFDFDVHHGQGTQSQFYASNDVLYISIHSYQNATFYPYLEEANVLHVGEDSGKGFNINIPWNESNLGDAEYMAAFLQIVLPVSYSFDPDFVVVSAGFDCLEGDFEGDMKVSPSCLAHMCYL